MTPEWLVIASLCDCNHVAITLMDYSIVTDTTPSANEIILIGDNWHDLVTEGGALLANRTGLRLSGTCTAVYLGGNADHETLSNDLVTHVYRVADGLALNRPLFA